MQLGGLRAVATPTPQPAPACRGWWYGTGPELRWSYPAAVYSACAACGLPCWPAGKAGSGWRREKVLQKPNQNAYRVSPSKILCQPELNRPCSRGASSSRSAPKLPLPQSLDARNEPGVQNHDALSRNVKQACCRISDTVFRLGDQPFCIPVPVATKDTGSSKDEQLLKTDVESGR